uniref:Uncharacterized protein n=1 Tax=Anguilla anguilla TaxID=7936 RepID=A0A0E9UHZ4_ANGAN
MGSCHGEYQAARNYGAFNVHFPIQLREDSAPLTHSQKPDPRDLNRYSLQQQPENKHAGVSGQLPSTQKARR